MTTLPPTLLSTQSIAMAAATFPDAAAGVVGPFAPAFAVAVAWGGGAPVAEGCQLTPAGCREQPAVCWAGEPGKLYTVILSDPDAPNPAEPKFAEWLHWCVRAAVVGRTGRL